MLIYQCQKHSDEQQILYINRERDLFLCIYLFMHVYNENDSFQVAVYGSHGNKRIKKSIWVYISKFWLYYRKSKFTSYNSDKDNNLANTISPLWTAYVNIM